MDNLINFANILYVIAYFTLDILRLRLLTTTAAICLAVYFYSQPEPSAQCRGLELVLRAFEPGSDRQNTEAALRPCITSQRGSPLKTTTGIIAVHGGAVIRWRLDDSLHHPASASPRRP